MSQVTRLARARVQMRLLAATLGRWTEVASDEQVLEIAPLLYEVLRGLSLQFPDGIHGEGCDGRCDGPPMAWGKLDSPTLN